MNLFSLEIASLKKIAIGIDRPEDVVVRRDGRVFASDHQCSVAELHADGSFTRLGPKGGAPNGINADREGRILIANFGIYDGEPGPLQRFNVETELHETLVGAIAGLALTSANYPIMDSVGNIWCANSTFAPTWPEALDGRDDGVLFVVRPDGRVDVMASGLRFPNGLALSADEKYLFCCETSAACVVRFEIEDTEFGRMLGNAELYGPALGPLMPSPVDPENLPGTEITQHLGYTDGCGMDSAGNLWVTLPAANKIVAITPDQQVFTIVHDPEGTILNHPTNIAWGGDDLCDLYIGSIRANYVLKTRTPIPGLAMVHQQ